MAWIEQLLNIVLERQADELRVLAGHEPRMLRRGEPRTLTIPKMSERDVRDLLGNLLSPEREAQAQRDGEARFEHTAGSGSVFQVVLVVQPTLGATFTRQLPLPVTTPESAPAEKTPLPTPAATAEAGTRALTALLVLAARVGASDVHLAEGERPRARVDGRLRLVGDGVTTDLAAFLGLGEEERAHFDRSHSLDLAKEVPGVGRLRVHVYSSLDGVAAAIRLLPPAAPSLTSLNLPTPIDDLALLPHGLVLVCGPAGAGKSTTLAALAQEALKRRSIVLVTLEDPVEYALQAGDGSVVRRRQLGRDVPSFAAGLRDALREDPDVLLVGEMRDPETIALALTAAETGHLVLASMHARSGASAVQRIFDSTAPERQQQIKAQLGDSVRAIIAQRLVPRLGRDGRLPVCEVLRGTAAVASTIRDGKTAQLTSIAQSTRRDGMISLESCLADRVRAGEISLDEARAAASDVSTLTLYMKDS